MQRGAILAIRKSQCEVHKVRTASLDIDIGKEINQSKGCKQRFGLELNLHHLGTHNSRIFMVNLLSIDIIFCFSNNRKHEGLSLIATIRTHTNIDLIRKLIVQICLIGNTKRCISK